MSQADRTMLLAVYALGTGNHSAGWRVEGASNRHSSIEVLKQIAATAERGKFDMFFLADSVAMSFNDHPSHQTRFEPLTALGALAMTTSHIGLGATVSTSFSEPYNVARAFSTLDHISGGRAGWNVVTSSFAGAARNFGAELAEHDKRYAVAGEFVDVVCGLWDGWEDGAVIADRHSGVYLDDSKVRPLNHVGEHFTVEGPLNIERSPQGHPLIIQAGGSPAGMELSSRIADIVFEVVQDPAAAKQFYDTLKGMAVQQGRKRDDVRILPGVMPIVGETEEDAREKLKDLQAFVTPTNALTLVSARLGHDISGLSLDSPVPDFPPSESSQAFSRTLLAKALRERLTLRDLYNLIAAARGHWVLCGTPTSIADTLEEWFVAERADGFMILPPYFNGAFDEFVDLVVPELQRRGLFKEEYAQGTMREKLGLPGRRDLAR